MEGKQLQNLQTAFLNVNGLVTTNKAEVLLRYLLASKQDAFLLQETHVYTQEIMNKSTKMWPGPCFWNLGKLMLCGVTISFNPRVNPVNAQYECDTEGRFIKLKEWIAGLDLTIINVYCPNEQSKEMNF